MYTLSQTLADQHNLNVLCADRPWGQVHEKFRGNAYYGAASVLKEYAGIPQTTPLNIIVPHGPSRSGTWVWSSERKNKLKRVFCYPPHRKKAYQMVGKKTILSAAPFAYAAEMLKKEPKPKRRGTLFFLSHSTRHVTTILDFQKLSDMLVDWDEKYRPVTLCIYWRDYNLGRHCLFRDRERGLQVISAGHMRDPNFLYRLYHLCSMHKYASGNAIASYIFYSIKAGCSYFYTKMDFVFTGDPEKLRRSGVVPKDKGYIRRVAEIQAMFTHPHKRMSVEQLALVDYYLGTQHLKSPKELRKVLL